MTARPADRPAALVTGGGQRLGRAIAVALADRGHDVAVHYHQSEEAAAETAKLVEARGVACQRLSADLAHPDAVASLVGAALTRFPQLGILVNNAARYDQATLRDTTPAAFDVQFAVNLRAPFFLIQAFARMVQRGDVINVIDNKVAFNQPAYAAYLLSKRGLADLTRLAALELAPAIRVNGIAPGVVLPSELRTREYLDWRAEGIPLRRQGDASDVVGALHYLLENRFVTGQVLFVDGGESIAGEGRHAANRPVA